jgi:hypothetical protein
MNIHVSITFMTACMQTAVLSTRLSCYYQMILWTPLVRQYCPCQYADAYVMTNADAHVIGTVLHVQQGMAWHSMYSTAWRGTGTFTISGKTRY